jgi:hypothetical protein
MEYQVVFDASQKGFDWFWVVVVPALGALLVFGIFQHRGNTTETTGFRGALEGARLGLLVVVMFFFLCIGVVAFGTSFANHLQAQDRLRSGNLQVVEGLTSDFKPSPRNDKGAESFTVNGVRFEYSAAAVTPGYNWTSNHGGPINRDGLPVRVHYFTETDLGDNIILKLEVGK